jgi:hypothetical protein
MNRAAIFFIREYIPFKVQLGIAYIPAGIDRHPRAIRLLNKTAAGGGVHPVQSHRFCVLTAGIGKHLADAAKSNGYGRQQE